MARQVGKPRKRGKRAARSSLLQLNLRLQQDKNNQVDSVTYQSYFNNRQRPGIVRYCKKQHWIEEGLLGGRKEKTQEGDQH